jgi:hypothetical protein
MKNLFCVLVGVVILLAGFTFAQEQVGELRGIVTDEEGSPLPGVAVEGTSPALIGKATSITDERGRYRLLRLTPGEYTITFTLSGFATVTQKEVRIIIGRTLSLDTVMKPAAVKEELTVIAAAPVVDITKSASTYEISKEMFSMLPRSRNFDSIITIASGVNEEDAQLNGISFDGASSSENTYYFDGMNTTDVRSGIIGEQIVFEHIEEIQVKSSGYQAEFGGSMGGVVNIITRSGGNEYHGEGIFYLGSSALQGEARPSLRISPYNVNEAGYIAYPKDDTGSYDIGLNLSGYVIKDRLWFFASYVPRFQITNRTVTFLKQPTQLPSKTNEYTQSERWDNASFKLTWQAMSKLRMSLSFNNNYYQFRGSLPSQDGSSSPDYDYARDGENSPQWMASFNADYIVSNKLLINVRAGRYFQNNGVSALRPPNYPRYYFSYSNISIPGVPANMIEPVGWYNYPAMYWTKKNVEARWSASIDATYYFDLAGEHEIKTGFNWVRSQRDTWRAYAQDYYYFYWGQNYSSQNHGLVTTPYGYMRVMDPYGYFGSPNSDRSVCYLQDSWTIKRLTLNLGVRLEKENYPSFLDPESDLAKQHPEYLRDAYTFGWGDKIAPRLGFAYDIFGNNKLKVFGSYGIYYDTMKLHMAAAVGGSVYSNHYYVIPPWAVQDFHLPEYAHHADNPPADLAPYYVESINMYLPAFDKIQPDIKPFSKVEYTFGFQGQLAKDISFSARFLHNHILWAIEDIGVLTPAGYQWYVANPGSDYVNDLYAASASIPKGVKCPKAIRRYNSLDIGIDKKFSNAWMAGMHYTLSRLWGNMSGLASSDEHGRTDPNTSCYFDAWHQAYTEHYPEQSLGLLNTDRTHQFKFFGAHSFDFGLNVGINVYAMSGTPESTEFYLNAKPIFYPAGRGDMGRTPFLWRADLYAEYNIKVSEKYHLQISANVANLTDNRVAQRLYNRYNYEAIWVSQDYIVNGFDYQQLAREAKVQLDARYGRQFYFQAPISVLLGVKLIF